MWAWDDPGWPRWELTLGGETMARLERIAEEQAVLDAEREESRRGAGAEPCATAS